jgi:hypothetical protein
MSCVEEAMAVLIALAAVHGKAKNGEARGDTTKTVAEIMRVVLEEADNLRKNTVRNIEILNIVQTVLFFATLAHRHLSFYWQGFRISVLRNCLRKPGKRYAWLCGFTGLIKVNLT